MAIYTRRKRLTLWIDAYEEAVLSADPAEFQGTPELEALARDTDALIDEVLGTNPASIVTPDWAPSRRRDRRGSHVPSAQNRRVHQPEPLRAAFSADASSIDDEDESEAD